MLKGLQNFKEMARVQVNIRVTCQFWKDKWGVEILQNRFSQAFSFAKDKQVNVRKAFNIDNVIKLFNLPLSQIAFLQAQEMHQEMETCNRNELEKDVWTYSAQSSKYRVGKTYIILMDHKPVEPLSNGCGNHTASQNTEFSSSC